jgi:hypothetical protein
MAESLAYKVSETTNSFLKQASFIFASTTEVITIDYKPWLSLHVYFCHKEKWSHGGQQCSGRERGHPYNTNVARWIG